MDLAFTHAGARESVLLAHNEGKGSNAVGCLI